MRTPSRLWLAAVTLTVGSGAVIVAGAASRAQTPAAAQSPTTPADTSKPAAAAAPPTVDPQARAILDQMVAAQQKLKSYSANVEISMVQGEQTRSMKGELSYALPNKVRAVITDPTGKITQTVVSNGDFRYVTSSAKPEQFGKEPAAPAAANIARAMLQSRLSAVGLLPLLIAEPQASARVVPAGASVSREADETVDGVSVDVVKITPPSTPDRPAPTITIAAGKTDHLLRRVVLRGPSGGGGQLTESYTSVKADPSLNASLFVFTPPPGAKAAVAQAEPLPYDARLKVGAAPLPVTGKDLAGQPVSLAQYKGKVVLMDFWATWCPPCREEVPNLVATYNKYRAKGFDVLGISLDRAEDRAKLVSYTKANKMPWRQVYDGKYWDAAMAKKYGVQAVPFTLLIGKDGRIAAVNPRGTELDPAVRAAVSK
jgi:outer membrane lipoprotein-sorting protein/peroxiredoxin